MAIFKFMKILYFGAGFVGACSAAVSADSGHSVLVYDINSELIKKLSSRDIDEIESCLFEKGLGEMIIRNQARIRFTDQIEDLNDYVNEVEAVFMCLPTPEKDSTGETNLAFYEKAAGELGRVLASRNNGGQSQYVLVINKSTVPVQMVNRTQEILDAAGVKNYGIGSNPEFLVEGKAIEGSIRPSRVVVGAWTEKDFQIFRDIYKRFCESPSSKYIEVNPFEAAAGKLLANYILFSRLGNCYDVVGRSCEVFDNLHFENIRRILVSDERIGEWGFYDSLYAGGSCFIKDARSLAHQLEAMDAKADLVRDTLAANERQLERFMERAEKDLGFDWTGKKVAILGLAFKRDTNDIRNSAALGVTKYLLSKQVGEIKGFDPVAGPNYLNYLKDEEGFAKIKLVPSEQEAMAEVDAMVIATDWPQFREISELIKKYLPKGALILDGRRMVSYKFQELADLGYKIIAVGSPTIKK